jgi:acetyl-CoA carboxylase carboxyltransferase component
LTPREELAEKRRRVRDEMGGIDRLERLRESGRLTARELIDDLLDPDSFREWGTLVVSRVREDWSRTAADGKIVGFGTVNKRHVAVAADDVTVKRGASGMMGGRKKSRIMKQAFDARIPLVLFGESAGARIPDTLGAEEASEFALDLLPSLRSRRIPMVSVIAGDSFGGSSFAAAQSDLVVQVRGSCLAITSPRLIEVSTGEAITAEELGGGDIHGRITGQVDLVVDREKDAVERVRDFLAYLPSHSMEFPPRLEPREAEEGLQDISQLVPARPQRAYDMRKVLRGLIDGGEMLELKPDFGPAVITALSRLGGHSVGIVASQPMHGAGALDHDACDKITRFASMCEAFNVPLIFLQDVPGFMVGSAVEHERLLSKIIKLQQALALATTPKFTVVVRKGFGLAYLALGGSPEVVDALYAWPSARIGFMDRRAGAHVLSGGDLSGLNGQTRSEVLAEKEETVEAEFDAWGPARRMRIDEVIDPEETREMLISDLDRYASRPILPIHERPLTAWPMW